MDRTIIRERYLCDSVSVRLGGLAANLLRINSFASRETNSAVVESLLDESKHFIEWTAAEVEIEKAAELIELQVQLALWQQNWLIIWSDSTQRKRVAEQSHIWSDRVLDLSGLLDA